MCGIAGVIQQNQQINKDLLGEMRDTFSYRGPDDKGLWIDQDDKIGLAHRRLSIIDPTPDGHQPMLDDETGNVIVFNGEVYNYIEIRKQLEKLGIQFKTHTDTEVILKAYRVYGQNCIKHFNGMFAIAIWDRSEKSLFLVRDRLGIKPLYYQQTEDGSLLFASEVKAIRKYINQSQDINVGLLDQYFSFGYIPGEKTLLKDINRLLPGCCAIYSNGELTISQYWDLEFDNQTDMGLNHYVEGVKEILNDSLDLRLRSDVPLGIFLSGGLDSSAVVALLSSRVEEQLKTFSVAFDFGSQYNESEYANIVSRKFNTDHHELIIDPESFCDFIPDYINLMDEPVTESAAIALHYISKLASEHVTVVLSGEGSDEIFAGYDLYKYMSVIERYRGIVGDAGANIINKLIGAVVNPNNKLSKYSLLSTIPLNKRYKGISVYEERYKDLLFNDQLKTTIKEDRSAELFLEKLFEKTRHLDTLSKMLYFDTKTWLVDDLLIKADRMSMASSLELRVPFLDYRLVEYAAKMPSKYKLNLKTSKYILKKMMHGLLPDEIIYRKKMGFPTPLSLMFKGGLKEYAYDTLMASNASLHQYLRKESIQQLLDEHMGSKFDHHRTLWQLVVLEEWFKNNKG